MDTPWLGIVTDNSRMIYFPGHPLTGHVTLDLNSDFKVKDIRIELTGSGYCEWKSKSREIEGGIISENEEYCCATQVLFGKEQTRSKGFELSKGQYRYPFSFTLPTGVPSTYEGASCFVRYVLTASIRSSEGSMKKALLPVNVANLLNLNKIDGQNLMTGREVTDKTTLRCLCRESNYITATLKLERTGFVPGETIVFNAEITNLSNRKVKRTKVQLEMIVTMKAWKGRYESVQRHKLCKVVRGPIFPERYDVYVNGGLAIPPLPPSYLTGSNIIHIEYRLALVVFLPGLSSSLRVYADVVIGGIPLAEVAAQHGVTLPVCSPPPAPSTRLTLPPITSTQGPSSRICLKSPSPVPGQSTRMTIPPITSVPDPLSRVVALSPKSPLESSSERECFSPLTSSQTPLTDVKNNPIASSSEMPTGSIVPLITSPEVSKRFTLPTTIVSPSVTVPVVTPPLRSSYGLTVSPPKTPPPGTSSEFIRPFKTPPPGAPSELIRPSKTPPPGTSSEFIGPSKTPPPGTSSELIRPSKTPPPGTSSEFNRPSKTPPPGTSSELIRPSKTPPPGTSSEFNRPSKTPPPGTSSELIRPSKTPPPGTSSELIRPSKTPPPGTSSEFNRPSKTPPPGASSEFIGPSKTPPPGTSFEFNRPSKTPPPGTSSEFIRPSKTPPPGTSSESNEQSKTPTPGTSSGFIGPTKTPPPGTSAGLTLQPLPALSRLSTRSPSGFNTSSLMPYLIPQASFVESTTDRARCGLTREEEKEGIAGVRSADIS